MSFEEEWAQLVAQAARERDARTQLNTAGGDKGGGSGEKLSVTPEVLTKRASKADTVRSNFAAADNAAMKETKEVAGGLKGFKSATAFGTFQDRWEDQMKYVEGLLATGVSKALRTAAAELRREDADQASKIKSIDKPKGVG